MESKQRSKCPCCYGEAIIIIKPAKWQGEKDKVVITHVKWQPPWK